MNEYNSFRRKSRKIKVGNLYIGGDAPLTVQSMTTTRGYEDTYRQMRELEDAGCDIIRMTVPDMDSVHVLSRLKESDLTMPIVADIHFDYKMAIEAAAAGADKVRINPGNIGNEERVKQVVNACRNAGIAIRVGVNSGSLDKKKLKKYGEVTPEALAESALENVRLLEKYDFNDIVVAVKSSNPYKMVAAAKIVAEKCDYPMHIGVTEAGTLKAGEAKGAAGIGGLLLSGIGDTIRFSLTADPVKEVESGRRLLAALGLDENNLLELVSCPTCGRTMIDLIGTAEKVEEALKNIKITKKMKVAIMGCIVNGPGEALDADVGIAGGKGEAVLFKKGVVVKKVPESQLVETLISEIEKIQKSST